jgi:hypothetical protein
VPRDANSTDINKILFFLSPALAERNENITHTRREKIRKLNVFITAEAILGGSFQLRRRRERSNNSQIDKATNFVFLLSYILYTSPTTSLRQQQQYYQCRLFLFGASFYENGSSR